MEVKVLSRETIMPSSPTPPHLQTFQLSLLDQLSPVLYVPLIYFYSMEKTDDPGHHNSKPVIIATLKSSLSETLSRFFLLAGRIVGKSISCSDEGAIFIEASVSCIMSEVLREPNNDVLKKLLPCSMLCTEPVEEHVQIIAQANIFSCGGIAISLCVLHKLVDETTLSCFLRSWASSNKEYSFDSSPKMTCSDYNAFSSLFPQSNSFPFHSQMRKSTFSSSDKKRRRLQRFVFGKKAISDLKAKAKSSDVPNPTCVEVITGFMWKHAMEASSTRTGSQKPSTLSHIVDMRKRIEPPLPEVCVGNILWATFSHYSASEIENDHHDQVELSELVGLLRHSFAKINNEYIKGLMGDEGSRAVLELLGDLNKFPSEVRNYYFCTSWRNMKFNEVDFGWGKPLWIGIAGDPNEIMGNVIVLLDTVLGDGVEVWMILDEEEMKLLEQNPQLLEFGLLNPSINIFVPQRGGLRDLNLALLDRSYM